MSYNHDILNHEEFKYVFENIPEHIVLDVKKQIKELGILTTARLKGYQTDDYNNLLIAGRLIIFDLRRSVSPSLRQYAEDMKDRLQEKYYRFMVDNHEILQKEIDKGVRAVYLNNDYFSISAYKASYLAKMSYDDGVSEIPEYLCMRQAIQLFHDQSMDRLIQCYNEILNQDYTMASPTLFNSCMKKNSLSSCYLGSVADDLTSILNTGVEFGLISKSCGAYGFDISCLRNSEINGGGKSNDISRWLQIFNAIAIACNQEGRRNGSCAVFCRTHHIDIEKFVSIVNKVGDRYETAHHINTSVYANRIFFDRVREKGKWTLFCPNKTKWLNKIYGEEFNQKYVETEILAEKNEKEYQRLKSLYDKVDKNDYQTYHELKLQFLEAKKNRITHKVIDANDLFNLICQTQLMCGQPFLTNADAVNFKCNQKNIGYIPGLNLCQEITLFSDDKEIASCNIGSISLFKFVIGKQGSITERYDFQRLGEVSSSMIDNLNAVIDHNYYPLDTYDEEGKLIPGKIRKNNMKNRPVGLGVQGFAEALYAMDLAIEYNKEEVELFNDMAFACMYFNSIARSVELSIQKGPYGNFKDSPLSLGKFQFDLWREEFELLGPNKTRMREPRIINPDEWGQKAILLSNGDAILSSWNSLRRCVMEYGVYNSMFLTIMPTATSSQILRNTEAVEMPTSNLYTRVLISGNYPVLNRFLFEDLNNLNLWNSITSDYLQVNEGSIQNFDLFVNKNKELFPNFTGDMTRLKFLTHKYKNMWEISQKYMINLMARRSRYICHSASLNIYLPRPSLDQLKASHLITNDHGLKTLMYYLRQKSSTETIKYTVKPEIQKLIKECVPSKTDHNNSNSEVIPMVCRRGVDCISCQ